MGDFFVMFKEEVFYNEESYFRFLDKLCDSGISFDSYLSFDYSVGLECWVVDYED